MPIYSGNRSGSMDILATEADMSYGPNDMARIMYESEINDMKVFEAVLRHDFQEIKGIREGTILESELRSLNEASKKHLLDSLMLKSKNAWAKIKGAMSNAANAVAAYVLRDGKAYATIFEKTFANKRDNFNGKTIQDVKVPSKDFAAAFKLPSFKNDFNKALSNRMNETGLDKTTLIQTGLQGCLGKFATGPVTPKEFKTICDENAFETTEVNDGNVDKMASYFVKNIKGGSEIIRSLKNAQSETEKKLMEAYNELKKAAKNVAKDTNAVAEAAADDTADAADDTAAPVEEPNVVTNLVVLAAAYEIIVSTYSKSKIGIAKKTLKYSRAALAKILAACKTATSNPDDTTDTVATEARCDIISGMYAIDEAFNMSSIDLNTYAIKGFVEAAII